MEVDIYNIKQVSQQLPKSLGLSYDRLYRFFTGNYSILNKAELEAVEKVLKSYNKEAMDIIKVAKSKVK